MNLVKIESHVDVSRPEQVEALNQFLKALNPDGVQAENAKEQEYSKNLKEKTKQIKEASSKKVEAEEVKSDFEKTVDTEASKNKEPEETPEEETTDAEEPKITREDIRELVSEKSFGGFREKIKEKLNTWGVPNVTQLPEKCFPEFHEFLTGLKK